MGEWHSLQPTLLPITYLVKGGLPKPVFPEQQGPGSGGSQQGAVFIRLLHLSPFPGAQVEQQ